VVSWFSAGGQRSPPLSAQENCAEFLLQESAYRFLPSSIESTQAASLIAVKLTRDQVESRKEKAVRFTRNVLGDSDRADEIEDESLEDYAVRRRIQLLNPRGGRVMAKRTETREELKERVAELEAENESLQDQLDAIADIVVPAEEEEEGEEEDEED
jgi:hypothetical protein